MLRWLRAAGAVAVVEEREPGAVEQSTPGIARVLGRLFGEPRQPQVLDLGQPGGSPAVYLADRGARVAVESLDPAPAIRGGAGPPEVRPRAAVTIAQPDAKFDLVLAWDHWDFVPPDGLAPLAAEVERVMAPGGWLVLFARDGAAAGPAGQDRPARYRMVADDRIVRLAGNGAARPRWTHPTRQIERALVPLAVQGVHLQRDGFREFIARKPAD